MLTPILVDGHKRAAWLAKRTRGLLDSDETVFWRVRRHGDAVAHDAARQLEGYLCERSHFPDGPDVLWCWRASRSSPPVGAMFYR